MKKRLFIGLISGTSLLLCLFLLLLWFIPHIGFTHIHPYASPIFGLLIICLIFLILWGWIGLILNIIFGRPILFSKRLRGLTIKLFLPIMTLIGRFLGVSKSKIRRSFIQVNNELVRSENERYSANDILLLMPHCLQNSACDMRLTYDVENCKRCGKCPIAGLLELREKYCLKLAIATGGTIARRIVVQARPKLIIAVACERDLSSGIQDTYPIPTYGVLNMRPKGPCLDTLVDLNNLEKAILHFLRQ